MLQLSRLLLVTIGLLWAAAEAQILVFVAAEEAASATTWTPADSAEVTSWWDLSDAGTVTEVTNEITALADKIGSNDMAACTGAGSSGGPDWVSNDYADFIGGECLEELSGTNTSTNEWTACVVAEFDTLDTGQAGYWTEANTGDPRGAGLHGLLVAVGTSGANLNTFDGYTGFGYATSAGLTWENAGYVVVCVTNNNGTGYMSVNGASGGGAGTWAGEADMDIVWGCGGCASGYNDEEWRLKEAVWSVGWTSDPTTCLEGYLAWENGITLDSGHTFFSAAPTTADGCP